MVDIIKTSCDVRNPPRFGTLSEQFWHFPDVIQTYPDIFDNVFRTFIFHRARIKVSIPAKFIKILLKLNDKWLNDKWFKWQSNDMWSFVIWNLGHLRNDKCQMIMYHLIKWLLIRKMVKWPGHFRTLLSCTVFPKCKLLNANLICHFNEFKYIHHDFSQIHHLLLRHLNH